MTQAILAEYIWLDAGRGVDDPMSRLRSKTRVYPNGLPRSNGKLEWDFDGSSTGQSDGDSADLPIRPVKTILDPFRGGRNILVLCEVFNQDSHTPHITNKRAALSAMMNLTNVQDADPWIGFEQEYMLMSKDGNPLGFTNGTAPPQGPYYCGVGAREVFGRDVMEEHLNLCLKAGLWIYGTNAEVCPGQWEFQIGPRIGETYKDSNKMALDVCDHVWLARYILHRVAEARGIDVSFHVKPVTRGDWNGSGMHTNFSTAKMRASGGISEIESVLPKLEEKHKDHIAVYGHDLHLRLTGKHETAPIDKFASGFSNRGASIRIPNKVRRQGHGYFEDRRPGASADPYQVAARLIQTTLM